MGQATWQAVQDIPYLRAKEGKASARVAPRRSKHAKSARIGILMEPPRDGETPEPGAMKRCW